MKITLLYFDDCPNWIETSSHLDTLAAEHSDIVVQRQVVDTPELADQHKFTGSPSVLIDGRDPFAEPEMAIGLSCRIYQTPDGPAGSPTLQQLREAVNLAPSVGSPSSTACAYRAVFFDFGGVVLTSPFEAFERYERDNGLPVDFIRTINSTNPDNNAWARMERGEVGIDGFAELFEVEAEALGHRVDGHAIIAMLAGQVRPAMVSAIEQIKSAGLVTACLTNNFNDRDDSGQRQDTRNTAETDKVKNVLAMFDHMVESSVIGVRKPERGFYEQALELAQVEASETIFLDDLGINLKPARAMGMTTIKVVDPTVALAELQKLLGLQLLDG